MDYLSFDCVSATFDLERLPARLSQHASAAGTFLMALLLVPAVLAILVPGAIALMLLLTRPGSVDPLSLLQLALAPLLALALCWFPIKRLAGRLFRRRTVLLGRRRIAVIDRGLSGTRITRAPFSDFGGIAHNVRSSLSGTRHEIVLVHADPTRSVVLHVDDRIAQTLVDRYALRLGLPQVSPRALYRLDPAGTSWLPRLSPAT